ncbi:S-adenosyl-L-methionine-dependent methyltransferase [Coniella lustricola]|uniref:S-adenosyl-L-methionine-dependent methyltransferase n=1 Tax=Coniella lustricola TaxID=2025994 RepID=A0A2T3AFR7_9PEZI|nr:S-adenosyl-L-methionine-dependent methyltransferase [Coniella lustricola]
MKDNAAKLFPNPDTGAKVMEYSVAHSTPLPDWLVKYHDWGCSDTDVPNYLTSTYQAQTLIFLARMMGAKRVLEIGVYIGFSTMFWSHAVGKDGSVTGLELSDKYAGLARKACAENKIDNVDIRVGDAVKSLENLTVTEPFDLVFIDANKEAYPEYLDILLAKSQPGQANRLLRAGGLIIADNVLRSAIVADDTERNPNVAEIVGRHGATSAEELIEPLRRFNKKLLEQPRLETVLLPLFDGLGMASLKD